MKKVLVVEDVNVISSAIRLILEKEGIDVIENSDGTKVLNIIRNKKIDLVILDLMMPGMSGAEIFELIKNDERIKKTKILILTAKIDALKINEKLKNCDCFMEKPFDNNVLVYEVKKLLNL
ncbi:MAG: response regulator [archaeon]